MSREQDIQALKQTISAIKDQLELYKTMTSQLINALASTDTGDNGLLEDIYGRLQKITRDAHNLEYNRLPAAIRALEEFEAKTEEGK